MSDKEKKKVKLSSVSLRDQMMILFVGAMFAGMMLQGVLMFFNLYTNTEKSLSSNIDTSVSAIAKSMEQAFLITENLVLELSASEGIQKWIRDESYYNRENPDFYLRRSELDSELQRVLVYSNAKKLNVIDYAVIYEEGELLEYTDLQAVGEAAILDESKQVYEGIARRQEDYVYTKLITGARNVIFHVRRVKADFTGENQLVLMVAANEQSIRERYSDLDTDNGAIVYLMDEQGQIVSSSRQEKIGAYIGEEFFQDAWEQYLVTEKEIKDFGLKFIYLYPREILTMQIFRGIQSYLGIGIVIIIVFLVIALVLGFRSTRFMDEFVFALNSVREKNYDVRIGTYKNKQLDRISKAFNEMTKETKELVQNKYESQLLLKEMEIRFLQHQMNPHFLFNVLLTIQIKAKRCKDETIFKMVSRLSALLRASISTRDINIITIREELEYVEFYLYLQSIRFEDKISYEITVEDEGIKECMIPKFSIEPIVENAVIHGIESIDAMGTIKIDLRREKEDLVILVKDNGIGFDTEKYKREMELMEMREIGGDREKVGLKNVMIRIRHIYGEPYGVKIESQRNRGTEIEIRIPAEVKQKCTIF